MIIVRACTMVIMYHVLGSHVFDAIQSEIWGAMSPGKSRGGWGAARPPNEGDSLRGGTVILFGGDCIIAGDGQR